MTKLRSFLGFLFVILLAAPALADPGPTVFSWVDRDGVHCFTDDPDLVPEAYRAVMIERTWEQVRADTADRMTEK